MINNSYKFPQTRTIHMQEKATEEVTTVPKTLRDVLIQSRNIFNKTLQSKLPENIWLSICKGGSSVSIPLSLLGSGKSAKNDDARQLLAGASASPAGFPQPFWRAEHEQVRVLPAR